MDSLRLVFTTIQYLISTGIIHHQPYILMKICIANQVEEKGEMDLLSCVVEKLVSAIPAGLKCETRTNYDPYK